MSAKKSKSSKFLSNCISEALMILMETKDYDDIAISEITSKAGVSRMTYYRTYSSKEDILIQYFTDYFETNFPKGSKEKPVSLNSWLKALFEAVLKYKDLVAKFSTNEKLTKMSIHFLVEQVKKYYEENYTLHLENPLEFYWIYYLAGALSLTIRNWLANNCTQSVKDMVNILSDFSRCSPFANPELESDQNQKS